MGAVIFRYNKAMERIIDKSIVFSCCLVTLLFFAATTEVVVGLLCAVTISALREAPVTFQKASEVLGYGYLVAALFFPGFVVFVPLLAYDLFRMRHWPVRLCWLIPLFVAIRSIPLTMILFLGVVGIIACCLAWRSNRVEEERREYRVLRDELRELSLSLEKKNRDLQEKQDYEIRLATLAERGRIAREIHDNVGHLLTRSVLQVEALQVVHANDQAIMTELEQVSATVHEAFETVRESVHDLHDDSFDFQSQLDSIIEQDIAFTLDASCQFEEVSSEVGYCFLAIAREALANTAKHSDASKVKLSFVEYPAFWQMVVHDNGSTNPFKSTTGSLVELRAGQDTGLGLRSMEERTRSFDGVFRVDYDQGVRVFVSIPKNQKG